jgi:redox-sensitive bicupin YhaK (pirin superfamily)
VPETDPVLQVVELRSMPWPTVDPFLFCVHHDDAYPPGDGRFGPAADLAGRSIGNDFSGRDGWSMYHGADVPGFPRHPHRGFETVTFARRGLIDHSDSVGAAARFGRGDVQWMTAGAGVVHAEMFPLLETDGPNPCELFQIWLNLPAADKMAEPHFTMLWGDLLPVHRIADAAGHTSTVTVLAGMFDEPTGTGTDRRPPAPPPRSWASRPEADVAIWHLVLDAGAELVLPPANGPDTVRTLYVFEGDSVTVGSTVVANRHAVVVRSDTGTRLAAGRRSVEILVLQGRPIGEPVAQYGPFVMNDRDGIEAAFRDYQRDGFGGWPWPEDGPVHGPEPVRFARHADGRIERRDDHPEVAGTQA